MKKLLLVIVTLLATVCANAQIMRVDELEKYAKEKYGDKWAEAAANIPKSIELDKNNAMTFVQVISCDGQSAEQLYVNLNY